MTSLIHSDTPPQTQPSEINATKIRDLYNKGTKSIRAEQQRYWVNASFMAGEMWVYWHTGRNQLLTLPRNPRKMRITIPRLRPESRRLMAKLLRRELVFEVPPDAPDDATIRGAHTAQAVLTDIARVHNWERAREELAWMTWKGGTGLLCLDWDSSAGQYLGNMNGDRNVGTGDICTTSLSIVEACCEPGTRDIERAVYWIKAVALPPADARRMYKLNDNPQADANAALSPLQTKLLAVGKEGSGTPPQSMTLVLTYYERPNDNNPQGTVCTVVGDKVVDGPYPWPFPFKDRLNVIAFRETVVEGRWTGDTILSDAVPVQTALNASWTSTLEHQKAAGNARLQASEASQDLVENRTDEAAEIIYWRDQKYEYLSPPSMPEWWVTLPERLNQQMDDVLGVHDVSRGEAPRNIESGLGIQILVEQDESPIGHLAKTMADGWGRYATLVLQTLEAKVTETRHSRIVYPKAPARKVDWTGKDFVGQTVARVPYEAVAPMSPAAQMAQALQLSNMHALDDPNTGTVDPVKLSALLDIPGTTNFIEVTDPDINHARYENYLMASGEIVVPEAWEDHAKHILEHLKEIKAIAWLSYPQKVQDGYLKHLQAHQTMAAEEAAQQAVKMDNAPALAGAPNATQPSTLASVTGGGNQPPTANPAAGSSGGPPPSNAWPLSPSGEPPPPTMFNQATSPPSQPPQPPR